MKTEEVGVVGVVGVVGRRQACKHVEAGHASQPENVSHELEHSQPFGLVLRHWLELGTGHGQFQE